METKFTSDPLADLAAVMRHHGLTFELDYGFGGFQCLEIYKDHQELMHVYPSVITPDIIAPVNKNE